MDSSFNNWNSDALSNLTSDFEWSVKREPASGHSNKLSLRLAVIGCRTNVQQIKLSINDSAGHAGSKIQFFVLYVLPPHVAMLLYTQLDDNALFIKNFTVSPACLARPYTLRLRLEVQITFITAKACVKFVISFGYTYYIYIVTNGRKHM